MLHSLRSFRKTSTRRRCGLLRVTVGEGKTSMCSLRDIGFEGLKAVCAHRRCASPSPMGKGDRRGEMKQRARGFCNPPRRWMRFLFFVQKDQPSRVGLFISNSPSRNSAVCRRPHGSAPPSTKGCRRKSTRPREGWAKALPPCCRGINKQDSAGYL